MQLLYCVSVQETNLPGGGVTTLGRQDPRGGFPHRQAGSEPAEQGGHLCAGRRAAGAKAQGVTLRGVPCRPVHSSLHRPPRPASGRQVSYTLLK